MQTKHNYRLVFCHHWRTVSLFGQKPKSLQLYNQIGNFWRVKGDASKAIECFRRSLAVSPNNAEVGDTWRGVGYLHCP